MRRAWEGLHIVHCDYCARLAASPHIELLEFWLGIHLALCAAAKQARLNATSSLGLESNLPRNAPPSGA